MNGNRRFLLLAVMAGLLVTALVVGRWATAPEYVALYRGLDLPQAGDITAQLDKASVAYRLTEGGTRVDVKAADAAKARVLLAKEGLPSRGRPGMELFDKPTWGMTDFTQRITYRRALEGELARTISSFQGVERAQVHLALPESSPLRRMERPAEAAVVLTLKPNASLAPDLVRGIALLVSSSVEQLSSDHVAVIDDRGELLAATDEGGAPIGLTSKQLEMQRGVETHLAAKVTELLSAVVGAGKIKTQVSARLNFAQVDRTVEEYDPEKQVLSNEQSSEGGDADSGTNPTIVNNSYLNSRRIEKQVGNVTRLSVSVMVDAQGLGTNPEDMRQRLEQVARSAVGIDSTRGDQLTVVSVPFEASPVPQLVGKADSIAAPSNLPVMIETFGRPILGLLAVLAVFILGWRALKQQPMTLGLPAPASAGGSFSQVDIPMPAVAPTPQHIQLRNRIQADSLGAPETAVKVIRAWLSEDS
jgi:flagellar M-ring protein FliF